MSVIYLILRGEVLQGPITLTDVPGIGCQMPDNAIELGGELADPAEGFVWVLVGGEPTLLADHRGTVYSTATGQAVAFDTLGDLPEGLTLNPPPDQFYIWADGAWKLDEVAQVADKTIKVKTDRDSRLAAAQLRIAPLQYASDLDIATEQEKSALLAWMRYSVNLNRVEQQPGFPLTVDWPLSPD